MTDNDTWAECQHCKRVWQVRSIPGVARADNLIVWYAVVSLPSGAKESVIYYGLEDFGRWRFRRRTIP